MGDPAIGKSLLIDGILPRLFGQCEASDLQRLLSNDNGAATILNTMVCKLSDKDLASDNDVKKAQQALTNLLAEHVINVKSLFSNPVNTEVYNLLMLSSNYDGGVAKLFKDKFQSLGDKVAVYKCGRGLLGLSPVPADPLALILPDIPKICGFLRYWHENRCGSSYFSPRYGVTAFMHPDVRAQIGEDMDESIIAEMLCALEAPLTALTATAIFEVLFDAHKGAMTGHTASKLAKNLKSLASSRPELVQMTEYGTAGKVKNRTFIITPPAKSSP